MTNINCSSNCIFQEDGKCCYEVIINSALDWNSDCIYFKEKASKEI